MTRQITRIVIEGAARIGNACEMFAAGKRRVCRFDRSGTYTKTFGAPEAVDWTKPGVCVAVANRDPKVADAVIL